MNALQFTTPADRGGELVGVNADQITAFIPSGSNTEIFTSDGKSVVVTKMFVEVLDAVDKKYRDLARDLVTLLRSQADILENLGKSKLADPTEWNKGYSAGLSDAAAAFRMVADDTSKLI